MHRTIRRKGGVKLLQRHTTARAENSSVQHACVSRQVRGNYSRIGLSLRLGYRCVFKRWRVSQWSKCSACDGKKGTRHRKVQCVRPAPIAGQDDIQANLDACKGRVPKQKEECVGEWSLLSPSILFD